MMKATTPSAIRQVAMIPQMRPALVSDLPLGSMVPASICLRSPLPIIHATIPSGAQMTRLRIPKTRMRPPWCGFIIGFKLAYVIRPGGAAVQAPNYGAINSTNSLVPGSKVSSISLGRSCVRRDRHSTAEAHRAAGFSVTRATACGSMTAGVRLEPDEP